MSDDAQKQNVKRRDFIAAGAVTAAATTMSPMVKANTGEKKNNAFRKTIMTLRT